MSERFFPDGMPAPLADATTLPWWQAAAEHRLVVQRCTACERTRLPPAPVCPECRGSDADWKELSGRGEVYTYTLVHRPIAAGQKLPYVIAVIALAGAGGVRMISNVVDVEVPDGLEVDMRLEAVFDDVTEEWTLPKFKPA